MSIWQPPNALFLRCPVHEGIDEYQDHVSLHVYVQHSLCLAQSGNRNSYQFVRAGETNNYLHCHCTFHVILLSNFSITLQYPILKTTCIHQFGSNVNCGGLFGNYSAVYKVCAGQLSLHLILMIATIKVKRSYESIGMLHNG